MSAPLTYHPLGIDSVTFACQEVGFWQRTLARLGFQAVDPARRGADGQGTAAMTYGGLRVLLVDPTSTEHGPEVRRFLAEHGDMQLFSATILVTDAAKAWQELAGRVRCTPLKTILDPLGRARTFRLALPLQSTVSWGLAERLDGRPIATTPAPWQCRGVDHFAIAVRDLAPWRELYQGLGFETIYVPKKEILGEYSAMKTVALQRGGWVVALVEGVSRERPSQVSTYVGAHGDHAVQHIAIRFDDLRATLAELMGRGVQFRLRRVRQVSSAPIVVEDIMHEGKDHSGPLLQCFTKPLARRRSQIDPTAYQAGFFFELIQRMALPAKATAEEQAFHDPTVIGLYRSIEHEEVEQDSGLVFADMEGYPFTKAA
ncbi:MAG: VOC family protein [Chloroflexi bacterium]|nr:VOC family protein [Chloroflexota bacterium]